METIKNGATIQETTLVQKEKIMYTKTNRIVYKDDKLLPTPNEINLCGELRIQKPYITSKFRENIRICASLRPLTNPLSLNEWQEILETKRLTNAKLNNFDINENRWFKEGINWVIPTPVFETTTIQFVTYDASAYA